MKRIVTIVGARPQFVKAAALSRAFLSIYPKEVEEIIIHTGQHYDDNMSRVFFEELAIPEPNLNLSVGGGSHGEMTGRMLGKLEKSLVEIQPEMILVYGDTNSTLAGALAASKLHIPIAHIEAGLRSYNRNMPEEINRVLTDHVSDLLFCPTVSSLNNLRKEGVVNGVHHVGDVMFDVALHYKEAKQAAGDILAKLDLEDKSFVLVTCHREENVSRVEKLEEILQGLNAIANELRVIFPMHPRTKKAVKEAGLEKLLKNLTVLQPASFLEMLRLQSGAALILTDSGGVQKEAFFYKVPCVTMREETEWVETINNGWNRLVGADRKKIEATVLEVLRVKMLPCKDQPFGDGKAAEKIAEKVLDF